MNLKTLAACTLFLLASANAVAGEIHYGSSSLGKEAACENAERRAKRAAESKRTCYEQCDVRRCNKDKDGEFVCRAESANHAGSCGGSDKIRVDRR